MKIITLLLIIITLSSCYFNKKLNRKFHYNKPNGKFGNVRIDIENGTAIKLLKYKTHLRMYKTPEKVMEKFEREISISEEITNKCGGRNVNEMIGYEYKGKDLEITFKLAEKGDMLAYYDKKIENNKRIEFSKLKRFFLQLTSALSCLYENDILHGDIKINNFFIDIDNNAFLGDFGESKHILDTSNISSFDRENLFGYFLYALIDVRPNIRNFFYLEDETVESSIENLLQNEEERKIANEVFQLWKDVSFKSGPKSLILSDLEKFTDILNGNGYERTESINNTDNNDTPPPTIRRTIRRTKPKRETKNRRKFS